MLIIEEFPGNGICSRLSHLGRLLPATHDEDFGRKTHDAIGMIRAESFEDLTFQFGQLFLRKHDEFCAKPIRHF